MSILIKNALIYDGRGQLPFKKDILIRGDQISGIGNISKSKSEELIDAEGGIVIPGFIDINSHADHHLQIFTNPEGLIKQGITTAIGGGGGSSLAPILTNSLKEIERWGSEPSLKMNVNWQSFHEFLKTLKKRGLGINFGSLVGYSSIKRALTENEPRDLTEREIDSFNKILKKSLKEGALGLSVSFQSGYSRGTPQREVEEPVKILAEANRVYATDLRNPEDPVRSLNEITDLVKDTAANVEINALMPLKSASAKYENLKEKIEEESSERKLNFDCQPHPYTKLPIHNLLPEQFQKPNLNETADLVLSGRDDEKIMEHLKSYVKKEIIITETPKNLESLKNKSLKQIANNRGKGQAETLLEIMKDTRFKATCLLGNVSEGILEKLMLSNVSLIASNGINSERQPFLEFINWVRKKTNAPFEKALMKATSLPAAKLGIKKRGVIKENCYADLILIKNEKISSVLINGQLAFHEGIVKSTKAGEIIK